MSKISYRSSKLLLRMPSWANCRNIAISNNVGGVKPYVHTLLDALIEERHFALVVGLRIPTLGSLLIVGVRNSVRPSHLFDPQLRS
jgi:hypothetical protein